jgi:hypothetical protein
MRYQVSWPAALVTVSLIGTTAVPAFAQSLADVARREAERRKQISEPAKVYTDKDLKAVPPPSSPPPATDAAAGAADAATPTGSETPATGAEPATPPEAGAGAGSEDKAAAGAAKTQDQWAGEMKDLQTKLDRDRVLLEAVQNRINSLTTDFTARDDPAQRDLIAQDRQRSLDELERLRKDIADDEQKITDLEDEARRAGVPPGWLRN